MKTASETHRRSDLLPAVGWNRRHCQEHPTTPCRDAEALNRVYAQCFAAEEAHRKATARRSFWESDLPLALGVLLCLLTALAYITALGYLA